MPLVLVILGQNLGVGRLGGNVGMWQYCDPTLGWSLYTLIITW
jgi:hypothetical protein